MKMCAIQMETVEKALPPQQLHDICISLPGSGASLSRLSFSCILTESVTKKKTYLANLANDV